MNAETIGIASVVLGAGRATLEDSIDYKAGISLIKKTGDRVNAGDTIAILYTDDESKIPEARDMILGCMKLSLTEPEEETLIYKVIK